MVAFQSLFSLLCCLDQQLSATSLKVFFGLHLGLPPSTLCIFRLHRIDAAYCYSHHTVCVLGTPVSPAKMGEAIEMTFGGRLTWAKRSTGVHTGATWRILLKVARVAVMQPYVKLVITCTSTILPLAKWIVKVIIFLLH